MTTMVSELFVATVGGRDMSREKRTLGWSPYPWQF